MLQNRHEKNSKSYAIGIYIQRREFYERNDEKKTRYKYQQLRLIAYFEMHYIVNVYLVNAPMKIGYLFCRWSQLNSLMFFKLFRLTTNPVALLQNGGGGSGDPKDVKRLTDMDSTEHNNLSI